MKEGLLDWDDGVDNGYSGTTHESHGSGFILDEVSDGGFDPLDITDPVSAYLLLSDDFQDEISGSSKKRMQCLSCGHRFTGENYDTCPECFSVNTEEILGIDDVEGLSDGFDMECMDCGRRFKGEIYNRCPECLSTDTDLATN